MAKNKEQTKKLAAKQPVMPSKTTMNLAFHESTVDPKRIIPVIIVLAVAALLLLKFGIIDPTAERVQAYNQLSSKQEQLASLSAMMTDYDELSYQYGRYSYGWMTDAEAGTVDRIDILDLIETKLARIATVENISINANVLTVNISGITLEQASNMVEDLESSALVQKASVYSASASDEELEAKIFMTIILEKEQEVEEE